MATKATAAKKTAGSGVEVLGKVDRVVKRPITTEDRAAIDKELHGLVEAGAHVERLRKRTSKMVAKLRAREDAIAAQIASLHCRWKAPTVDQVEGCEVQRTTTEIRIVAKDGTVIDRRALTAEELAHLRTIPMPGVEAPQVHHPELDADDAARDFEENRREEREALADLSRLIDMEEIEIQVDDEAASAADEKTTKKSGRKSAQQELPLGGKS